MSKVICLRTYREFRVELEPVEMFSGIRVIHAQHPDDARMIAIHLLEPTRRELEDAMETAERDLFSAIVIHTRATWPRK